MLYTYTRACVIHIYSPHWHIKGRKPKHVARYTRKHLVKPSIWSKNKDKEKTSQNRNQKDRTTMVLCGENIKALLKKVKITRIPLLINQPRIKKFTLASEKGKARSPGQFSLSILSSCHLFSTYSRKDSFVTSLLKPIPLFFSIFLVTSKPLQWPTRSRMICLSSSHIFLLSVPAILSLRLKTQAHIKIFSFV